jgi:type IV pilus assembly protein PilO
MELGFDPVEILRLPLFKKIGVGLLILLLIAGGYWHFSLGEQLRMIDANNFAIATQVKSISMKKRMLNQLPRLRKELVILQEKEAKAARKLPSKKEIPALLTDISNAGHEQGLEFTLFAPKPEIRVAVYAKVPVEVWVSGPYHETLLFMNHVARLSRIVTFSNLDMQPKNGILHTKAWVMTYRFLEVAKQRKKKSKKKKRKGNK